MGKQDFSGKPLKYVYIFQYNKQALNRQKYSRSLDKISIFKENQNLPLLK